MLRLIPIVIMIAEIFGFRARWAWIAYDALIVKRSLGGLGRKTRHVR